MVLSICIATFNRSNYLDQTLKSVLDNRFNLNDFKEIELVIVDGGSIDSTDIVVNKYLKLGLNINYVKLSEKGGIDKDFDIAVRSAANEYCWLLPDDDFITSSAIKTILYNIKKYSPDVIVNNSSCCSFDLKKDLNDSNLNIKDDVLISDFHFADQLFGITSGYTSYIGSIVIKTDIWKSTNTPLYYGTRFIHIGVLSNISARSVILISHVPIIKIRLGNAEWANVSFKIWYVLWPSIVGLFSFKNEKLRDKLLLKNYISIFSLVSYHRALETFNYGNYKEFVLKSKDPYKIFIGFIILCFPSFILRYLYIFRYFITRNQVGIFNMTFGRKSRNEWKSTE
jgi:glycosyltransferase involved in cell wall biosynthesis